MNFDNPLLLFRWIFKLYLIVFTEDIFRVSLSYNVPLVRKTTPSGIKENQSDLLSDSWLTHFIVNMKIFNLKNECCVRRCFLLCRETLYLN